ncbi:hypothetical protein PR003_g22519 [Phytophthora rubi]|uniref:Uncharacterized protein n=1 Tax=Phytophthora rubi TaxID=129364 RepID=A0A6A4DFA4_9STRA|nr:hypothetical protein PR003_g22519 [Phytophthora rubi]
MQQTKINGKQLAIRKTVKKEVKFFDKHLTVYGLKIMARHATTGEVETVVCRFCITFGKEARANARRARTTDPKFFNCFRTDLFERHLKGQHPLKWSKYCDLSTHDERNDFFKSVSVPFAEPIPSAFEGEETLEFQKIDTLTSEKKETVVNAVAQMYLLAIQNIHALSIPTESTLPVTPKELVASSMVVLLSTIEAHHNQLTLHFGEEEINRVSKEFQLLRHEYSSKKPIQEAIDTFDHRLASFEEMWQLDDAATRFPTLAHD